MKRLFFCWMMFAVLAVYADENTHRAAVLELLEVTDVQALLDNVYGQVEQIMATTVQQMGVEESQRPVVEKYMKRMTEAMKAEMNWPKLQEPFVAMYMSVFTEAEVREIVQFYKSPIGQKVLEKMPLIMQQSMQISQQMMTGFFPRIQEIQQEMAAELQELRQQEGAQ
ncbi:MAG TPA: DUF2059 domain-containing protein [Calditrichia bacterium]|nr:DUF2059 domain-containing protein [Calditrichota bacterium]HQV31917.1 DUF2059 domain-containing protein [Calditrichia bacterium]